MDKQMYKELLSEEMIETSKYKRKLDYIWKLVYDTPNNMILGKKLRELFWEMKDDEEA